MQRDSTNHNSTADMVVVESPSVIGLSHAASKRSITNRSVNNNKLFTGTTDQETDKALRTYMNEIGPGQYNLPSLTGRHSLESKRRNIPSISFGGKTKAPWHSEFHTDFVGQSSPASTRYSPQLGKTSGERSLSKLGKMGSEKKFRIPSSIAKMKETLPVQYGGAYQVDSINNGFSSILKRVNGKTMTQIESMNKDQRRTYRQVSMGFGTRSDFTKVPQQQHDPGFLYDQQNQVNSIKNKLSRNQQTKESSNTFGNSYNQYDKSMVGSGLQHWTGRGPACDLPNDGKDLALTKKKVRTIANSNRDRGLLIQGHLKDQKQSRMPGPGNYDTVDYSSMMGQLQQKMSRRSPMKAQTNMSQASREFCMAKYTSNNAKIYGNGLM